MVHEPVDERSDGYRVAEDLRPAREGLVGAHDERASLIAGGHQGEEQRSGLGIKGDVTHLVHDEQGDATELLQFLIQPSLLLGLGQSCHPLLRRRELHPIASAGRLDRKSDGEMGLPGPRRPEEDDVLLLPQEVRAAPDD